MTEHQDRPSPARDHRPSDLNLSQKVIVGTETGLLGVFNTWLFGVFTGLKPDLGIGDAMSKSTALESRAKAAERTIKTYDRAAKLNLRVVDQSPDVVEKVVARANETLSAASLTKNGVRAISQSVKDYAKASPRIAVLALGGGTALTAFNMAKAVRETRVSNQLDAFESANLVSPTLSPASDWAKQVNAEKGVDASRLPGLTR